MQQYCCLHLSKKEMLDDVEDDVWWKSNFVPACCWIQQRWTMLHQHVASVWPGLNETTYTKTKLAFKGRFRRYDFVAYDKLTTGLRHELFRVNQTDRRVRHKKCRRILKHVLKSYANRRKRQYWMTRVVCDFLHDASSARSRNRMRQSWAKVVPSKSALRRPQISSKLHRRHKGNPCWGRWSFFQHLWLCFSNGN